MHERTDETHTVTGERLHLVTPTHPDLATVLAWFVGDIDGRQLLVNIKDLHRDPDWRVQSILGRTLWDIDLIYWPTRSMCNMRLEPVAGSNDAVWRQAAA